jgi:tetratricopeptide (TPR) repeat protein
VAEVFDSELGKWLLYFDLEDFELAIEYFQKALKIRQTKGQQLLIDSTNFAIQIAMANLEHNL